MSKRSLPHATVTRHIYSAALETAPMGDFEYVCEIDAEPLHRYRPGGYHPTSIGDVLNNGRYRVLHKLGWGGYSTVWAARDERAQRYVAVKIAVSERVQARETRVMQAIATTKLEHPGFIHLLSMSDHFQLHGPNGTHACLVLEIMGPSIPDVVERRFRDERLPGKLAKSIAKQALLGLDCLHQQGIAHGDLHTRNLAFTVPSMHSLSEKAFLQMLKEGEIGAVRRQDGNPLEAGVPEYLVRPAYYPVDLSLPSPTIKIIDFGESFLGTDIPDELHTPLVVRPPEAIFIDKLDYRVDLWTMGCTIFELVTGQPPFDSIMITPSSLVKQMLEITSDELPEPWQAAWRAMTGAEARQESDQILRQWLEEVYFDGEMEARFTREDITKVGDLVQRMLRLEPAARASARQILQDPWFQHE